MKTQVVQFEIDSGNGSMEATITVGRAYDDVFFPDPPSSADVPPDIRKAVMEWLGEPTIKPFEPLHNPVGHQA
jgi:hypothetical protein